MPNSLANPGFRNIAPNTKPQSPIRHRTSVRPAANINVRSSLKRLRKCKKPKCRELKRPARHGADVRETNVSKNRARRVSTWFTPGQNLQRQSLRRSRVDKNANRPNLLI